MGLEEATTLLLLPLCTACSAQPYASLFPCLEGFEAGRPASLAPCYAVPTAARGMALHCMAKLALPPCAICFLPLLASQRKAMCHSPTLH